MASLLDSSILCRLANSADVDHAFATGAIAKLHGRSESIHITAQNLIEFRSVATRPTGVNGLGLTSASASHLSSIFEASFSLLPETPDIYPMWRSIVDALGIIGKTVHDARLVAVCHVHGVSQILTFNVNHFTTLSSFGSGIAVLNPRTM